jgi:hypothetical protein
MDPHFIIALFHILVVVPFLGYIFVQRAATPEYIYNILFFVGIFVLVYHFYKAVLRIKSQSSALWISLIHVLLFAPLMIYIGYKSKKTPRYAYELLGLTTFSALGYHLYSIVLMTQVISVDE